MKKLFVGLLVIMLVLPACGRALKNGNYEGRSTEDSRGAYSIVTIEVEEGKIAAAEFLQYNADGTLKDETYGNQSDEDSYKLAQKALEVSSQYPQKLVETQDVGEVDALTGATSSWKQFQEATKDALAKAK